MYYKHKQWLEEASTDSQILSLIRKRKDKHLELIYLKHEYNRALQMFGFAHCRYHEAVEEYREIDLDLSLMDGRYQIVTEKPAKKKSTKKALDAFKKMSNQEKESLIAELKKMK